MKHLVGKKIRKTVKFAGDELEISKLSVGQVLEIQEAAKDIEGDDEKSMDVLKLVIRLSVKGAKDLTDEDFAQFPMDELSKLSNEVMKFSGMGAAEGN